MENFLTEIDLLETCGRRGEFTFRLHVLIKSFAEQIYHTSYLFTITSYISLPLHYYLLLLSYYGVLS